MKKRLLLMLIIFCSVGCQPSDKDIMRDFAQRVEYLSMMLPQPFAHNRPEGKPIYAWSAFGASVEIKDEGYLDYDYEIHKTDSLTKPYRAALTFSKQEKPTPDQVFQDTRYYKAVFTRSAEKKARWLMESFKEKDATPESEWKESTELNWIEDLINTPKKQISSDLKKRREEQDKMRKLKRKWQKDAAKDKR